MRQISERFRNLLWKSVNLLPLRHRLQMRVCLARLRLTDMEPVWYSLANLGPNKGIALDVGANRGLYSYELSRLYEQVIAFEPNEIISEELRAVRKGNIKVKNLGLSDSGGQRTLFVPTQTNGHQLDGWASLDEENLPERVALSAFPIVTTTLDSLDLSGVTFMKMDVEGHEVEVLAGGRRFFACNRPTVLLEVREENTESVRSLMADSGLWQKSMERHTDGMLLFSPT